MQRELTRTNLSFTSIVFVRNDVYQLLMDQTADFGKESKADLDWRDAELLRNMMRMRLIQNDLPKKASFEEAWSSICVSHVDGEESSQFMIDRSLMRPRNFLKLFNCCRGFAVNLQHEKIQQEDIIKGLDAYSNDLLVEADQELADIDRKASRLIYNFLGESTEYTHEELKILLDNGELTPDDTDKVIEFMLYYGILGISYAGNDPQYIFDIGYNMEIFKTRITKNLAAIRFTLNPAFWPALHINTSNQK
jgi:hypothetical protein